MKHHIQSHISWLENPAENSSLQENLENKGWLNNERLQGPEACFETDEAFE